MKDISQILRSLGLLESEVKTYITSLTLGPSTVIDLSKRTGLSRQATYVAIESLAQRGLMTSALRGKKKLFVAERPDKLLAYAKRHETEMTERIKDLQKLIPELELQTGGERPVVRLFEGRDALIAIYEAIYAEKPKELLEIADTETLAKILPEADRKPLREAAAKLAGRIRAIYTGTDRVGDERFKKHILPKEFSGFKSSVLIFGDKAVVTSFEGKIHSAVIESRAIANGLRVLFNLATRGLEK